jgi:hypothetical protein
MLLRILLALCFTVGVANAQDIQYVFAENGLIVREKPNQGSIKIGLLDYGTPVEILESTDLKLDVRDNHNKISGEWVKIRGTEANEFFDVGYVFSGYLTEDRIEKPLKVAFEEFTILIENLGANSKEIQLNDDNNDEKAYLIELGETLYEKNLKVKHHQEYRSIQVFQRHQNTISIANEGPHCDLVDYKHFTSRWKPLKMYPGSGNIYKTLNFSPKEYELFIIVKMEELQAHVKEHCGDQWYTMIENVSSIKDAPYQVGVNQIHLRIVMTDIDGYKTEKIIIFELPMGC